MKKNIPTLDIEKIDAYHYSPPFKATEKHEILINTIQDVAEEVLGYRPEKSTADGLKDEELRTTFIKAKPVREILDNVNR